MEDKVYKGILGALSKTAAGLIYTDWTEGLPEEDREKIKENLNALQYTTPGYIPAAILGSILGAGAHRITKNINYIKEIPMLPVAALGALGAGIGTYIGGNEDKENIQKQLIEAAANKEI
jgi:hypothetical protein